MISNKNIKYKKVIILLMIGMMIPSGLWSQDLNVDLQNKVYPLLSNNGKTVMAASEYSALYPIDLGLDLKGTPMDNGAYSQPEFLVLHHFINIKEGNLTLLSELYDEESKDQLPELFDMNEAMAAYRDFDNFELLSKAVFGDFVRIRYNFINKAGEPIPWILMARKIGQRWYLTESMSIEHLFIDVSSVNPENFGREKFANTNVNALEAFLFTADGLETIPIQNQIAGNIGVYFQINKIDAQDGGESGAVLLLMQMKESLRDSSNQKFIQLWDPENKEMFQSSEYYANQIEIQREFYNQIDQLKPLAYLKAGKELVLFYVSEKAGQQSELQLLPMREVNGKYKLCTELENYYAWQILNKKIVRQLITDSLVN
jgi:hypothetical protein